MTVEFIVDGPREMEDDWTAEEKPLDGHAGQERPKVLAGIKAHRFTDASAYLRRL